jgi:hypothetical protein
MFEEEEVQRIRDQLSAARHNYDQARRDLEAEQRARQQLVDERDEYDRQRRLYHADMMQVREQRDAALARADAAESALATARREAQEAREALALADRWVLNRADEEVRRAAPFPVIWDHACAECIPGGPLLTPGFRCAIHAARSRALASPVAPRAEYTAVYYLADGSEVRLPREEVERRRRAAAKVVDCARSAMFDLHTYDEVENPTARALSEALLELGPEPVLAKHQPCGCVVCTCENEAEPDRCLGCGAKHCGTHPVGAIPSPVYAPAPREEPGDGGKNGGAR